MSLTNDPAGHLDEPVVAPHTVPAAPAKDAPPTEPVATSAALATAAPARSEERRSNGDRRGKLDTGGLVASATALVGKLRTEVPKKVRDAREKRAVGRHVVLTERDGRPVAIGPFASSNEAQRIAQRVSGAPTVVELVSETAFFPARAEVR